MKWGNPNLNTVLAFEDSSSGEMLLLCSLPLKQKKKEKKKWLENKLMSDSNPKPFKNIF